MKILTSDLHEDRDKIILRMLTMYLTAPEAKAHFKEIVDSKKQEIDIELIIDGKSYDPNIFFERMFSSYKEDLQEQANEIVQERWMYEDNKLLHHDENTNNK
jgi:hypothetical protein